MPFKKVGNDSYTSPSGRHFNGAQVRLYYAHGGHFPGQEGHSGGGAVNKGYMSKTESFAAGGPVLGRTRDFMKTPDTFREEGGNATDEVYGKGSKAPSDHVAAPPARGKSLKAVTPRK